MAAQNRDLVVIDFGPTILSNNENPTVKFTFVLVVHHVIADCASYPPTVSWPYLRM